jgi:hypothetical protein
MRSPRPLQCDRISCQRLAQAEHWLFSSDDRYPCYCVRPVAFVVSITVFEMNLDLVDWEMLRVWGNFSDQREKSCELG